MTDDFSIYFEPPEHGWLTVVISSGGRELREDVSHVCPDSIPSLIVAAISALSESGQFRASFCLEPGELVVEISANAGRCRLRVYESGPTAQSSERLATTEFAALALATRLWRALRDVWGRTGEDHWTRHRAPGFPESSVDNLGRQLNAS